jgi:hypothetical protein
MACSTIAHDFGRNTADSRESTIFSLLSFDNLPFRDRRRLIVLEINLILSAAGGFDNRLDRRIYNLSAVHFHADANFVTDFGLFTGHAQRVSRRGMPTSCAVLSISTSVLFSSHST